jgi:methanogenic corrinoid protein MtbC1
MRGRVRVAKETKTVNLCVLSKDILDIVEEYFSDQGYEVYNLGWENPQEMPKAPVITFKCKLPTIKESRDVDPNQ